MESKMKERMKTNEEFKKKIFCTEKSTFPYTLNALSHKKLNLVLFHHD